MLKIKTIADERGRLSVIQSSDIPFKIKRVFWIQGMNKKERGNHANYRSRQCMICIKGRCRVRLDDGKNKEEAILGNDSKGLIIEPNIWRTMFNFSSDCILLVLASGEYDEKDYIRSYEKFREVYQNDSIC